MLSSMHLHCVFFFNDTATTEIYTLSLHDALPISGGRVRGASAVARRVPRGPGAMARAVRGAGDPDRPVRGGPHGRGTRPATARTAELHRGADRPLRGQGHPVPRGAPPRSVRWGGLALPGVPCRGLRRDGHRERSGGRAREREGARSDAALSDHLGRGGRGDLEMAGPRRSATRPGAAPAHGVRGPRILRAAGPRRRGGAGPRAVRVPAPRVPAAPGRAQGYPGGHPRARPGDRGRRVRLTARSSPAQAATTSRALTGAPSQKRASVRSVNVQGRLTTSLVHDSARPGSTRPRQSTRMSVSYNCRNTNRSASFSGAGACAGSTGCVRAMTKESGVIARPAMTSHALSRGAGVGSAGPPRATRAG